MNEYDYEPQRGLPETLPKGEKLLWQGGPRWQTLAIEAFHARKVLIYFAAIGVLQALVRLANDSTLTQALTPLIWLIPLGLIASAILVALAWLSAWTTIYTITSKRIVMRIGLALPAAVNIPFRMIDSASVKVNSDGTGDVPVVLRNGNHLAFMLLWPHARRWHIAKPQPMLRAIPDADRVASLMVKALSESATQGLSDLAQGQSTVRGPAAVAAA
jgi:Bacterial PH domain